MKKLLSLPPRPAAEFYQITGLDRKEWFCSTDPQGIKVGSGGGTIAMLDNWREACGDEADTERCVMVHACGESRRLPAYATIGKVLTPIPVFRWASGQAVDQTLLSLQMPYYEKIMETAPASLRLMVASGDVLLVSDSPINNIPEADVVCLGIWVDPSQAVNHGVFVLDRDNSSRLVAMLQKPSIEQLASMSADHFFLMDTGVWLLSDRAIKILDKRSRRDDGTVGYYDLYSDFGRALGSNPTTDDAEVNSLSVAIVSLTDSRFYHFGTSAELLGSTLALQSMVTDQRQILQNKIKPSASLFTQNCRNQYSLDASNRNVWIENAHIGPGWHLTHENIITGVPVNEWGLTLNPGICLDVVPIGSESYAARPYGYNDKMRGKISDPSTMWMGQPIAGWFAARGIAPEDNDADIQYAPLFPASNDLGKLERIIRWMITPTDDTEAATLWQRSQRMSAAELSAEINLSRAVGQRTDFLIENIQGMARNYERSVFYQLDLDDLASKYRKYSIPAPDTLPASAPAMQRSRNHMLRYRITGDQAEERLAFDTLREIILDSIDNSKLQPVLNAAGDQIIWARSPLRIDLAGGWTDTPPYSLLNGGNVVNVAVELNGQPPLQCFIKPSEKPVIVFRSIDMSASETVTDYSGLCDFNQVGAAFSIPKAALILAGFGPGFASRSYNSLSEQLEHFGSGIEITLLSAVPAGSGLGTSSILAATVLAAISEFTGLAWDKTELCRRTLALEQMLTTGGGWQDQYGGVLEGVKLLQTAAGVDQTPLVKWLPEKIFTDSDYSQCHLLYYTGITRVAKHILTDIVRGMSLNRGPELRLLGEMKDHALDMADALQRSDFERYGKLVGKSLRQNIALDSGTAPDTIQEIIGRVAPYCLGLKLPGAGGGGFIYMVARDPAAAMEIRRNLNGNPPNPKARFVEMSLSPTGLQVSRS